MFDTDNSGEIDI